MDYPTIDEIREATPERVIHWWRNLAPGMTLNERAVLSFLTVRYRELEEHPDFDEVSGKIGWNSWSRS